jgi:membrane-associated phospholipid phosphatase
VNTTPSVRRLRAWLSAAALAAAMLHGAVGSALLAEDAPSVPEVNRFGGRYLGKAAVDFGKVLVSPAHWQGKDFAVLGAAAGLTAIFFVADPGARDWVAKHPDIGSSRFSLFITHLGEAPFLVGLSTVFYLGGEVFKEDSLRKTALMSLESFAINGLIVTGIKVVLARSRPAAGDGPYQFNWFSTRSRQNSFPSGHTSSAFAVASVIAGESDSVAVGTLVYGLASLVGVSRVVNNEHWASDVFVGAVLGYFIGKQVLALNRPSAKNKPKLSVAPAPGGFSLALSF